MGALIFKYFLIAMPLRATVYGFGEMMCGDIGKPVACDKNATTASGEPFDPEIASAAIPLPTPIRMVAFDIEIRAFDGRCVKVRVNDKSNPRWIGRRGLDISPKALEELTGKRNRKWSGKLQFCNLPLP